MTWLTPAGFDWELWNATSTFGRSPPTAATGTATMARGKQMVALDIANVGSRGMMSIASAREQIRWMLALGAVSSGGELAAFSMGSTCE